MMQFEMDMNDAINQAIQENEEHLAAIQNSFGGLAETAFIDFGCDEQCFEDCFAVERGDLGSFQDDEAYIEAAAMCAETSCCSATDAVTVHPPTYTQTNTQCVFNQAK
jgi:hypothetical protein